VTEGPGAGLLIADVVRYVRDPDRSLAFWTGPMGFELRRDAEVMPGRRWVEVCPPGRETGIVLLRATDYDVDPHGGDAGFTIVVPDLRDFHARMVAAGVTVTEPADEGGGVYLTLTCPDGFQHVVSQPAAETPGP
jgi:catechol 2,3-dioxygenase-like lactoylglutathione lyase family enzyme